jgi:tRNA modification GTPase
VIGTMSISAAVTTAKGAGAIATIELHGENAQRILENIFRSASGKKADFKTGSIHVGTITEDGRDIDQVTIGCEAKNHFAIHCHGNPLIAEAIMNLLEKYDVTLLTYKQFFSKVHGEKDSTIATEAKIKLAETKTLFAAKLILNQADAGLTKAAKNWLANADDIEKIKAEAFEILEKTEKAQLVTAGCKAVITGPPNSGKSSLINILCGQDKAIVTDIEGTTRDYVTAEIVLDNLFVELTDTAGIDEAMALKADVIEKTSQKKSLETLRQADLVLLVLDSSKNNFQFSQSLLEAIADKKTIVCLNKSDLPGKLNKTSLPTRLGKGISVSAKNGSGIDNLKREILRLCCADEVDIYEPVVFTLRQRQILERLSKNNSADQGKLLITELLNGQLNV